MKKVLSVVLAFALLAACLPVWGQSIESVNIYVNNDPMPDGTGMIIDDCTMCGVRTVSESFGCRVDWDEAMQKATIYSPDGADACGMVIGSRTAYYLNGSTSEMTGAPVLLNDTTMVPIRAISEFLGKTLIWDSVTSTAFIDSPEAYAAVTSADWYISEAAVSPVFARADAYLAAGQLYEAQAELDTIDVNALTSDAAAEVAAKKAEVAAQIQNYDEQTVKKVVYARAGKFSYVDVHSEPDWSSPVIFTVPFDNAVGFVSDVGNGFARIEYNGSFGYLEKAYLKDNPPSTFVTKVLYAANVNEVAYIRSAPAEGASIVATIPIDSAVGYIEDLDDFYRVEFQGNYGYMYSRYLTDREPSRNVTRVLYVTGVAEAASLRKAPSADSSVIVNVPLNGAVGYIGDYGDFYRVEYQGKYGYILVRYLTDKKPATNVSKVLYVTNVKESASLRTAPSDSASVVADVPLNGAVGYIEDYGDFYRVEYQGKYGYMKVMYLTDAAPPPPVTDNSSGFVYYTPSGTRYHKSLLCPTLDNSRTVYFTDVSHAQAMGLGQCQVCKNYSN